ncbi:ribonuclease H-like domain-containing protein [Tanacetum coccineum]|uniref:Ribonuclease H-like domain-containing protein n=1 Tax=Tanacetum coccineum TaxID=301880 RepID=A0ABQ4X755_9ASTR
MPTNPTNLLNTPPQTQPSSPLNTTTPNTLLNSAYKSASLTAAAQQQPHQPHTSPLDSAQQVQLTPDHQPITASILVRQQPPPIPLNTHQMVTHAKDVISKPVNHLSLHTTTTSPISRSHIHSLHDPFWQKAMHKFNVDGSLSRYKACLVANGRNQELGIDYDETFSPVVKPDTIRTRSLYGLKQASRAWFQRFASYATRVGFQHTKNYSSLFIFHSGTNIAYLLFYVDDIILTVSSTAFLQRVVSLLHGEFAMTDLGSLNYSLGVSAQRSTTGLFLSQATYAKELLERAHIRNCNPCRTLVDTNSKLGPDGNPVSDPTLYHSLASGLQGTLDYDLQLHVSNTDWLTTYTDADWAGCHVTRRSTFGYCVFLGENLLSWSTKRQATLSSVVYHSNNSVQHPCTKHIELDIHFVRDFVANGLERVMHVPFRYRYADIFTKRLPSALFQEFRSSLNVRIPPAPSTGCSS